MEILDGLVALMHRGYEDAVGRATIELIGECVHKLLNKIQQFGIWQFFWMSEQLCK